jgi:hypothetical protein
LSAFRTAFEFWSDGNGAAGADPSGSRASGPKSDSKTICAVRAGKTPMLPHTWQRQRTPGSATQRARYAQGAI